MTTPQWENLRNELERLAGLVNAFNAYVFDAWDNYWCAARGFSSFPRGDLLDMVHAAEAKALAPLRRGGTVDRCLSGSMGHFYVRSYASCYLLLLRFSGPFDCKGTREAIADNLQRLTALTLALPPPDGPGSGGHEDALRA